MSYLDIAHDSVDLSEQRKLVCWPEQGIVRASCDIQYIDLIHQQWELCKASSLAELDKACQQSVVSWARDIPLLMCMHERDEVQVIAAQSVQDASKERADITLMHLSKPATEISVIAITHTFDCLQH